MRAALEVLAARTVADLPHSEKARALEDLRTALEAMRRAEGDTLHVGLEADVEFRRTLCRISGNQQLLQSWEQVSGVVRMSIMFAGTERARKNVAASRHQEVIDLIEKNPRDLEVRITAHILDVLNVLDDFDLDLEG